MSERLITSLQNPQVKATVRLRDARHRQKQGRMLIEGRRELARALESGVAPIVAFYLASAAEDPEVAALCRRLEQAGTELWAVAPPVYERLAFGSRAEGLLAVAPLPLAKLADLRLPANPLVAVLEGVEKPGNVGAVLRSADAAGVSAVVIADGRADLFNPQTIRASLGAVFSLSVAEATSAETLAWLRQQGLACFAARVGAPDDYTQAPLAGPSALILGSEAAGLSPLWTSGEVRPIGLPMCGQVDSLNVSVTAAVLFYEALRQRRAVGRSAAG